MIFNSLYTGNEILNTKVISLHNILHSMMSTPNWEQRPECSQVLAEYNEWSIDRNILANDTQFEFTLSRLQSNDNQFFFKFLSHFLQKPNEMSSIQIRKYNFLK